MMLSRTGAAPRPPYDDSSAESRDRAPRSPNCVTIFGAGIAGLTAAHELVERGFQVQVWERQTDQRYPRRGCDVGGMARTQWSRVHWPELRVVDGDPTFDEEPGDRKDPQKDPRPEYGTSTQTIVPIPQKFYVRFNDRDDWSDPEIVAALGESGLVDDPGDVATEVQALLRRNEQIRHVYAEVCYGKREYRPDDPDELKLRAAEVIEQLRGYLAKIDPALESFDTSQLPRRVVLRERGIKFDIVILEEFPSSVPEGTDVVIGFRVRERWLPGEHGYRFFPSFYHHLFDTMKRTPILEAAEKSTFSQQQERAVMLDEPEPVRYTESGRTAFDNLRPLTSQVLAFLTGARPAVFTRFRPRTLEEVREYVRVLFGPEDAGGFALDLRDAMRIYLKSLQFLTACDERRAGYEEKSWWEFVGGADLGAAAQRLTQSWPRALVAMDAESADARSHGIGMAQLLLDLARPDGYRDGTLRGPTNEAWLNPWRRYLEAQGVEFIHGELQGFEKLSFGRAGEEVIWPVVKNFEPRYALAKPPGSVEAEDEGSLEPELMPGYFIVAVSTLEAREIAKSFCKAAYGEVEKAPADSDMAKMARFADDVAPAAIRTPPEKSRDFRHFVGIQYYFAEDVFWVDGHVYYPDSAWSLTSVSQARFWQDRTDWEHGYRGILSVIIGDWQKAGSAKVDHKTASECSTEELAREVWSQIRSSIRRDLDSRVRGRSHAGTLERTVGEELPCPLYYHVDDNYTYSEDQGAGQNASPFPITAPRSWDKRPGSTEDDYKIEHGVLLAGAHLKTFTRLPTMEAANESGRRATNAILNHTSRSKMKGARYRRTLCDLWNPEDREIEDLRWYKDLDKELHARGVPHVLDVLGVDVLIRDLLRGGPEDPLDPVVILTRIQRLMGRFWPRRGKEKGECDEDQ